MPARSSASIFFLLCLLFASLYAETVPEEDGEDRDSKVLLCYFQSSAADWQGRGRFTGDNLDPDLCTHIAYGYAMPLQTPSGIVIEDVRKKAFDGLMNEVLILKDVNPKLKVLVSIASWIEGAANFSVFSSTPEQRTQFSSAVLKFLSEYKFDGVDLAWLTPNLNDDRPEEKEYFTLLMKDLWENLNPKGYLLTAYIHGKPKSLEKRYDLYKIWEYLDFMSLATYHFNGIYQKKTGINAPLRSSDHLNIGFVVDSALSKGVPANKILLGFPVFGHQFLMDSYHYRDHIGVPANTTYRAKWTGSTNILGYNEICWYMQKERGWEKYWDDTSLTPYAVNKRKFISYDDVDSFKAKVKLAEIKSLKGGMIWSLEMDDFEGNCAEENYILTKTVKRLFNIYTDEFTYSVKVENAALSPF